jgi:phytoene dehydrogenase-like protein
MSQRSTYDAVIIGAGPNGLAAAIRLAQSGRSVLVLEAKDTIGGGARTAELTLPGFQHDMCSAIHPLGKASPFLRSLPLEECGVKWIQPDAALAHPMDDGTAVIIERSIQATAKGLGVDAQAYRRLMEPLVADWEKIMVDLLGPLPLPPRHPLAMARFGLGAIRSAAGLAQGVFHGERAKAVFAGMAAHSMLQLEKPATAAFGLVLGILAHAVGWPVPQGGSQSIIDSMANYLHSLGGEIRTGFPVKGLEDLPPARALLFDVTPRQLLQITGERLPQAYRRQLKGYRYGPGVFKIDYALDGPIPWKAEECSRAGTVHLGGRLEEISAAESAVWRGEHPQKPLVLLAQQSLFDPTRAPRGKHTAWAYCHVPHGSAQDMTGPIEAQIERFAPGFRHRVLARCTHNAVEMEHYNPNYIGGDINGGVQDLRQLFTRPTVRWVPYSTPDEDIYLCSSSTPPGGGVHGMCGFHAAQAALKRSLR